MCSREATCKAPSVSTVGGKYARTISSGFMSAHLPMHSAYCEWPRERQTQR